MNHVIADSATMLRRNLRHALRYPSMTVSLAMTPVFMLLLFVYVFGGALKGALPGGHYVDYLTPGILLMTAAGGGMQTAVAICTDMTEGIIDRFRTMAIARTSVLTGHVLGSVVQTMISIVLVVAVALAMGFRPAAGPLGWLAATAILMLLSYGITWVSVALGLISKTPEAASNVTLPALMLPFASSAFVPTSSMPAGLRWFAEYQPFTPIIDALRGLLSGTSTGHNVPVALGWCAVITLAGHLWSRRLYDRAR
jgi:ABC-2 type transport system permease protein